MSVTYKELSSISSTLVNLLHQGFGPNALQTLLATSTGKLVITSDGMQILQLMNLSHPVGKMMFESVSAHHKITGNNCKAFMIVLSEILKSIEAHCTSNRMNTEENEGKIRLSQGFADFKLHLLPDVVKELQNKSTTVCITSNNLKVIKTVFHNILLTSLHGRFPYATGKHLTTLTLELIFGHTFEMSKIANVVRNMVKTFEFLYHEINGMHPLSSLILEGVVIERDFHFLSPKLSQQNCVNFVLYGSSIDEIESEAAGQPIISARSRDTLHQAVTSKVALVQKIVSLLLQNEAHLLICSEKASDLVTHVCRNAGISVIQMVPLEEMERLATICGIHIIGNPVQLTEANFIGKVQQCRPYITGGRKCVLMQGLRKVSELHTNKQILICGQSPGVCQQIRFAIFNGLKNILMLMDEKNVLNCYCSSKGTKPEQRELHGHAVYCPGGGYFEMLLYKVLSQRSTLHQQHLPVSNVVNLLKDTILTVPLQLVKNSYIGNSSEVPMKTVLAMLQTESGINGMSGHKLDEADTIFEPLAGKILLLYNLCELMEQILRLDCIAPSKRIQVQVPDEL